MFVLKVIEAFEKNGFEFLKQVFNVPKYLEDMVGLTELHASIVYDDVSMTSHRRVLIHET